jgi:hypothetical protein
MTRDDDASTRRYRALRAARAVTLGVALAAVSGCSTSHSGEDTSPPPDGGDATVDGSSDSAVDTGMDCTSSDWWDTEECCELSGGFWSGGGCAVPGPFVPPEASV